MKRRILGIFATISLLIGLAGGVLTVRSFWTYDAYNWEHFDGNGGSSRPFRFSLLYTQSGLLTYIREDRERSATWAGRPGYFRYWNGIKEVTAPPPALAAKTRPVIVGPDWFGRYRSQSVLCIRIPLPSLFVLGTILPLFWLRLREARAT